MLSKGGRGRELNQPHEPLFRRGGHGGGGTGDEGAGSGERGGGGREERGRGTGEEGAGWGIGVAG